jgi:hypothetical protein
MTIKAPKFSSIAQTVRGTAPATVSTQQLSCNRRTTTLMDQVRSQLPIRSNFYVCKFLHLHVLIHFTRSVDLNLQSQHDRKNRTPIVTQIPQMAHGMSGPKSLHGKMLDAIEATPPQADWLLPSDSTTRNICPLTATTQESRPHHAYHQTHEAVCCGLGVIGKL